MARLVWSDRKVMVTWITTLQPRWAEKYCRKHNMQRLMGNNSKTGSAPVSQAIWSYCKHIWDLMILWSIQVKILYKPNMQNIHYSNQSFPTSTKKRPTIPNIKLANPIFSNTHQKTKALHLVCCIHAQLLGNFQILLCYHLIMLDCQLFYWTLKPNGLLSQYVKGLTDRI